MSQIVTAYINRCMDEIVTLKRVRGISPLLHGNEKLVLESETLISKHLFS